MRVIYINKNIFLKNKIKILCGQKETSHPQQKNETYILRQKQNSNAAYSLNSRQENTNTMITKWTDLFLSKYMSS